MQEKSIDPRHKSTRNLLQIGGPILIVAGLAFIVIGMVSFFAALGGLGPPRYFWCAFVGMPLLFAGSALTMFGFLGRVARYQAQEIAPVAKDTFNYMAAGTAEGVKTVAGAIGQGLREGGFPGEPKTVAGAIGQGLREGGFGGESKTVARCLKCNAMVAADAKFCGRCGQALGKTKPCPQCRESNDPDAKFCDNCGHEYA